MEKELKDKLIEARSQYTYHQKQMEYYDEVIRILNRSDKDWHS